MTRAATAAATIGLVLALAWAGITAQQAPQASFRSRITIVPVDVRVLDRNGKPITDLKQSDFTILEDGRPQVIQHFSTEALTADPTAAASSPALRRAATTSSDLKPQGRRIFLIVLGRGRMRGPSKELPALEAFLESRLLPQDQVAVMAYNRGTDFTTDHQMLRTLVERYGERHEKIETMLEEEFRGLRAVYGGTTLPAYIQKEVDGVFGEMSFRPRAIATGQPRDAGQIQSDVRRTTEDLQRAELLKKRTGEFASMPDPGAMRTAESLDLTFDEYVASQVGLNQDVGNLYAGIDYLRYLDGEKHLIFLTPTGVSLPRLENNKTLAEFAGDARVALDIVYIGGAIDAGMSSARVFSQTFAISELRTMTDMTGGQMTAFQSAESFFRRVDDATRFQYLLGYAPTNTSANGAFRRIEIRVARPGATVLHRQGYYATPQIVPLDRRQFITMSRLMAAGRYGGKIPDITVTLKPPVIQRSAGHREIVVEGRFQSDKIKFDRVGDLYLASVDVGIYSVDAKLNAVGETLRRIELKLKEQSYLGFLEEGSAFNARIAATGEPKYVKAIVYDYGADLLGSAVATIK